MYMHVFICVQNTHTHTHDGSTGREKGDLHNIYRIFFVFFPPAPRMADKYALLHQFFKKQKCLLGEKRHDRDQFANTETACEKHPKRTKMSKSRTGIQNFGWRQIPTVRDSNGGLTRAPSP